MATKNIAMTAALSGATFAAGDLANITIDGVVISTLGATVSADATTISIPGYGSLTHTGATTLKFTASSSFPAGDFTFVDFDGTDKFTEIDLSSATNAVTVLASAATTKVTGGAGNDSITGGAATATIVGGAGNDTITTSLAGGSTVTGGTGADKIVQGVAGAMVVTDYNYAEGDTINLKAAVNGGASLTATGAWVSGVNTATVTAAATDNVYKVKVTDTTASPTVKEFWTAAATSNVTMDGSTITSAMVLDASQAVNAKIQGGTGNDAITMGGAGISTLVVNKSGGDDTVTGFTAATDIVNLSDATMSDVTFTGPTMKVGATSITGASAATDGNIIIKDSTTTKKVGYAAATTRTITANADATMFVGFNDKTTTLNSSAVGTDTSVVNLQDTTTYKDIYNVTRTKGGVYIGTTNSAQGSTFNLTGSTAASEFWGGSAASDAVTLASANQDTVWFGTTDGKDTVTGFTSGFASTADLLNLYNVADVTSLEVTTVTAATNALITTAAGNQVQLSGTAVALTNSVDLKVKDSAGVVKKLSMSAAAANSTLTGVGADVVIGRSGKVDTVAYGATQTTDIIVNLQDAAKYKSVEYVDLTGTAATTTNVVVGTSDSVTGSKVTLAGAVTDVWGGSKGADSITAGAGVDTIWFGTNDGNDTVTGFTVGTDKVKFYDKALSELAGAYTYTGSVLTSKTNTADKLTFTAAGNDIVIDVLDKNNIAGKVRVAGAPDALTYDSAVKAYIGNGAATLTAAATRDNVVLYLGNTASNPVNDIYFAGVKEINASAVIGQTVLIGSASTNNVLKAGISSSAMWGGGVSADTMTGAVGGVDEYWFGSGDGLDVVNAGVDSTDKVVLHNLSVNDVTMTKNAGSFVVTAKDGSTLTVTDAGLVALNGGLTFQFGVNSSAQNYTYDTTNNKFVAKA